MRRSLAIPLRCLTLAAAVAGLDAASLDAGVFYAFEPHAVRTTGKSNVRGTLDDAAPEDSPARSAARRRKSEVSAMVDASTRDLGIEKHSGNQNPAGGGSGGSRQNPWDKPKKSGGGAGAGGGGGGGSGGRSSVPVTPPTKDPDDGSPKPTDPGTDGSNANTSAAGTSKISAAIQSELSGIASRDAAKEETGASKSADASGSNDGSSSNRSGSAASGSTSTTTTTAGTANSAGGGETSNVPSIESLETLSNELTGFARNSASTLSSESSASPTVAGFLGGGQDSAPPIVPEPSTAALLAISLGCVAARRWRSGRASRTSSAG